MAYKSSSIAGVIRRLNRDYYLPAIQRPYVWTPDQIVRLFDSLLKGYPISSFLFWDIEPAQATTLDIYKFVEDFKYGDFHNETAIVAPDAGSGRSATIDITVDRLARHLQGQAQRQALAEP
ncbi:hypothetical protein AO263_24410 [Pseudomonas sp. NZIPFR-PS5]|nr:hypothetical protein AO263_24410 [Pseudomonas sp. NZIPFR-PS5]